MTTPLDTFKEAMAPIVAAIAGNKTTEDAVVRTILTAAHTLLDETLEEVAKAVWHAQKKHTHTAGPAIPDNCDLCTFNNGIHAAKRVVNSHKSNV